MNKEHHYTIEVKWTGNLGKGTLSSAAYTRDHEISKKMGHTILGSSDPAFRGNPERYNPEELLLSTLSSCHMLMYLHFCSQNQITVVEYIDNSVGVMVEHERGSGCFISATLKPCIKILEHDKLEQATHLHHQSHEDCFIANSINFPLDVEPEIEVVR